VAGRREVIVAQVAANKAGERDTLEAASQTDTRTVLANSDGSLSFATGLAFILGRVSSLRGGVGVVMGGVFVKWRGDLLVML
jgi:hypothetical protein